MTELTNKKIAILAATSIACGGAIGYGLLTTQLKRTIEVFSCNNREIETIVQSGPEYVIINPTITWDRNSFAVSMQIPNSPYNWRLRGLTTKKAQWSGFRIVANEEEKQPIVKEITFEASSKKLNIKYATNSYNSYKPEDVTVTCRREENYADLAKEANNFPIEYLEERTSGLTLTMPSLNNRRFNESLSQAIQGRENSDYTHYQLLNLRNVASLSSAEKDRLQSLREKLIDKNTTRRVVWEFSGDFRGWHEPQYPNEAYEARNNAREWCKSNQNYTRSDYTKKGYVVVKSNYQQRGSRNFGWIRKNYPDGRFSGYVKYKAECDGTNYQLVKKGTVDDKSVNTYYQPEL